MKFSCKLIHYFININDDGTEMLEKKLAISGIELEYIKDSTKDNDKVLELSITTNRKEISSALHLAIEIYNTTNTKFKIIPIEFNPENTLTTKYFIVHLVFAQNVKDIPEWLELELKKHNIKSNSILFNIQKYIQIKWGSTFEVLRLQDFKKLKNIINEEYHFALPQIQKITSQASKQSSNTIIIFKGKQNIVSKKNYVYDQDTFYMNMYYDAMKLISTISNGPVSKAYKANMEVQNKYLTLKLKKSNINKVLGYVSGQKLKFIQTSIIHNILHKLQLFPKYNKKDKSFELIIPNHRSHDLTREIDIIEEIGRIYEFKNFSEEIRNSKSKKIKSKTLKFIREIRNMMRNLGLNEVINCCLVANKISNKNQIEINNPISLEQKELRKNIVENLINNYKHNIKHTQKSIELFEIGKIFKIDLNNRRLESQQLGGLIYNTNYSRKNWTEKSNNIDIFHIKGAIETFLERIHADTNIAQVDASINDQYFNDIIKILKINRIMGIYNNKTKTLMGILGELKENLASVSDQKRHQVYIFEINIEELFNSTTKQSHLNYIYTTNSKYPSVKRDISIKLDNKTNIEEIKITILNEFKLFVESIEIFNEYINTSMERYVGMRLTYRAYNKTLNYHDIEIIDKKIKDTLKKLKF